VLLGCLLAGSAGAEKVSGIKVRREGGGLIEDAAVLGFVSVKVGEELNRTALSRDVRALEESGRFAFVATEVEKTADGLNLIYVVRSKPRINSIRIEGADEIGNKKVRELREELRELLPERIAAREAARKEALRYNFISALILTAQNGFGRDVEPFLALCRETWGEEQWWDAVKDLPHGRVRQGAAVPFGFEGGPFSAGRTHVMYAAQAGDVARLTWLLARGARLELKDWKGRTALCCW
jgi:hypothetical protein